MKFEKFTCRQCGVETYSITKFIKHCREEHNIKHLTARDWRFVFRWHIITQILMVVLQLPLIIVLLLVWLVCYPFWLIKEFIDNI